MTALAEPEPAMWRATDRQATFLACSEYEALYGGSAGGGKTQALVMGALYDIHEPSYNAIIFRRTFPELEGEVIPVSRQWYPLCGGRYNAVQHCWTFPSGARIHFGHLQHEHDVERYQGWQFQYVGFDELTHFTEKQYTYIANSRVRSAQGVMARVRSGTNPGGPGHEWVFKRWAPWLDPESVATAEPGTALHYHNRNDGPEWCAKGDSGALGRAFFPATIDDNPHLAVNDPGYKSRLRGLDVVTREQLLNGNWLIKPAAGLLFKRGWFDVVAASPSQAQRVRYWDRAATKDGDWTVGVKLAKDPGGHLCVEHVERLRGTPRDVEAAIRRIAEQDGIGVTVGIEQDPGAAGVFEAQYYARALQGFNVRLQRPTGDKVTRAQPISAQCEAGNVSLVKGPWLDKFLAELEAFPDENTHDDQVDAFSGAFTFLVNNPADIGFGRSHGRRL